MNTNQSEINLDNFISSLITEKNKNTYEDILLGAIKMPSSIQYTQESNRRLQQNNLIMSSIIKEYKINLVREKKKKLSKSISAINQKINEIKYEMHNRYVPPSNQIKIKPIKITKMRSYSKLNNEEEEDKLENDARNFVKKLQEAKKLRYQKSQEKRMKLNEVYFNSLERSLKDMNAQYQKNKNIEQKQKIYLQKNYNSAQNSTSNIKSNQSYRAQHDSYRNINVKLPMIPSNKISVTNSNSQNIFDNLSNGEINLSVSKAYYANMDVSGGKNTILETSGIKRSPYYFNEPKYNRIIEIKEKFGNKIKEINNNTNDNTLLLNEL